MLLLLQIGNIGICYKLLFHIKILLKHYSIFFMFSILNTLNVNIVKFEKILHAFGIKNYIIDRHENKGMDIGPYFKQMQFILNTFKSNEFNYIFKIHTKSDNVWRKELLDPIIDFLLNNENQDQILVSSTKWHLPMDKLNERHINKICKKCKIKNIFYDKIKTDTNITIDDLDVDFYTNYYNVQIKNCSQLDDMFGYDFNKQFLFEHMCQNKNIPSIKWIKKVRRIPNVKFVAGTIFLMNYEIVYNFFKNIDIDSIYSYLEEDYTINNRSTYVHSWERIISNVHLIKFIL